MTRTMAIAMFLAACGGSSGGNGGTSVDAPGGGGGGDGSQQNIDAPATSQLTIFTILLENHDYAEIVGSSHAPYINQLIAQGALATNYKDSGTHPSLPNYLYLVSGDTQYPGIIDLGPTTYPFPVDAKNLGDQLVTANIKWRSYQESMGTPCRLSSSGNYAPKHDPFLYFKDIQKAANNLCVDTSVDYSQFAGDLATDSYRYMWITPNLLSDGHNPSNDPVAALTASDTWLSNEVPKILASDAYKNGGILFITWDEAEGRNGDDPDQVPMIVLSPKLKMQGMTSNTAWTHASYLATVEDLLGLPRLATVTSTPNMMELFAM